jgi:hypothetical protein
MITQYTWSGGCVARQKVQLQFSKNMTLGFQGLLAQMRCILKVSLANARQSAL